MLGGSNYKKVKKIAKKAYKKMPKKELVGKAATYGVKKIIGGPYLDIFNIFYKKSKKTAISYVGTYAYDSFLRSKFARDKINTLPMSIVSMIIRVVFNFLIFSRLVTGIKMLDFVLSMIVTTIITLMAPFFYTSIKAHDDFFLLHTNYVIDRFMGPGGWEYIEKIKNRLLLSIGILLIFILQFIKINSRFVQEFIVHALITGFVSDLIQRWIDVPKIRQLHFGMTNVMAKNYQYQLSYVNDTIWRKAHVCNTNNLKVIGAPDKTRAKIIPYDGLKDYAKKYFKKNKKNKKINKNITKQLYINIIDEYETNR